METKEMLINMLDKPKDKPSIEDGGQETMSIKLALETRKREGNQKNDYGRKRSIFRK